MNKRLIILGILFLAICSVAKLIYVALNHIKIDDFHKAAVIFVLDTSKNNQNMLEEEQVYLKSLCAILDPEDSIKILKADNSAYLIYEGTPSDNSSIKKAFDEYTKSESADADYNLGIKKAVDYAITMKNEGYTSAVVVVGSLQDSTNVSKQINWEILPKNIAKTKEYLPDFAMMFVYAPPEKLDLVKTKLNPILGEKKLIVANSANIDKANRRFLQAIGR